MGDIAMLSLLNRLLSFKNFAYYKVKDENEVNELFYREYGMYPKITMSLKDVFI